MRDYLEAQAALRPLDTEADWIAAGNPVGVLENRELIELHQAGEGCGRWFGQANGIKQDLPCPTCDDTPHFRGLDEHGKQLIISRADATRQNWAWHLKHYDVEWDPTLRF